MTLECRFVRWLSLQGLNFIRITVTLSDMSDSCLLQSFSSNSTSLCCYENYMDDVDYFVWYGLHKQLKLNQLMGRTKHDRQGRVDLWAEIT
jgi:hypothetical protein